MPLRLADISRRAGLDRATTLRILTSLNELNLVHKNPDTRRYTPGTGLYSLLPTDIRSVSRPHLEALSQDIQETICLITDQGLERECIDVLQPTRELRIVAEAGKCRPVHVGTAGRVLMAFKSPAEIETILESGDWSPVRSDKCPDKDAYLKQLESVRKRGFIFMPSELSVGSTSIAAPIFGKSKDVEAAIAIRAPETRMPKSTVKEFAPRLIKATQAISHALGYRP